MKTRILHILNSSKVGGIEKFVYYLVNAQKTDPKVDVEVLFCGEDGPLKDLFDNLSIKYQSIIIKPFDLDIKKYVRLIKLIKDFDIVHIHSFKPIRDWVVYRYAKNTVYTVHSVFGFGRAERKTDSIRRGIFKAFMNAKNTFLTYNSNYTKDFWEKRGIRNTRSRVVYNGIVFKEVDQTQKRISDLISENNFVVGTSCRLIEWKRVDFLVKAFAEFQKEREDVTLLIVGNGEEKAKLEGLVSILNIKDKVVFAGEVVDVQNYQNRMDVCVFPSTTESFGLVAIECMYYGKPVLVMNDGGGITEVINMIEPENICADITELASAIERYYLNPENIKNNRKKRTEFAKRFDIHEVSAEFTDIYIDLCESAKN